MIAHLSTEGTAREAWARASAYQEIGPLEDATVVEQYELFPPETEEYSTDLIIAYTPALESLVSTIYSVIARQSVSEGSLTAWFGWPDVDTEITRARIRTLTGLSIAIHHPWPDLYVQSFAEHVKSRLQARGIVCGVDSETADQYSSATDMSLDQIRSQLAGIPTFAIESAFRAERRR